jgi:hypothetical protein
MVHKKEDPLFGGLDYAFWKTKMEGFIVSLGFEVWNSIEDGYTMPTNVLTIDDEKNGKERYDLLSGLANLEFLKVMSYKSTKEIWKNLESIYEGDDKVK